jgi:hypothetical protein
MIATESVCAVRINAVPGETDKFTAGVWNKADFVSKARSHLMEVGDVEVTIDLFRLTPEEKVMLRAVAHELGREVSEGSFEVGLAAPNMLSRSQILTMSTASMSKISSSSKFSNTSPRELSKKTLQFTISKPTVDVNEMEATLTGTEVAQATPPEDSWPEANHNHLLQRAWRRRRVIQDVFAEYASEELMSWQIFWELCEERGLADLGQSRLRESFNAASTKQVDVWGPMKGLRLEYFMLLLHELAVATSWSNASVVQLAA